MARDDVAGLVARGYDRIADAYLAWSSDPALRLRQLEMLAARLAPGSRVLELGCGAGVPVARQMASLGYLVTGVDVSPVQVGKARANVPGAAFVQADMGALELPPGGFDAVVAFYAITHVPRASHAALFARIALWLKPGGLFLASLGARDCPDWRGEWLGTEMFFSHFDGETNHRLVEEAGFAIVETETIAEQEHGAPVEFLWLLAQAP